jgi:hypothetical protein
LYAVKDLVYVGLDNRRSKKRKLFFEYGFFPSQTAKPLLEVTGCFSPSLIFLTSQEQKRIFREIFFLKKYFDNYLKRKGSANMLLFLWLNVNKVD